MLHYCRYLRHKLVVGLGVQWLASSSRSSAASTLQLCIGSRCLLFQLRHAGSIPRFLERFLADPDITFVGVWNHSDAGRLRNYNLQVCKLLDLRIIAAKSRGLVNNLSMESLAEEVLGYGGVHKPSSVGMSNWDAYWLSVEQVQYACVDAVVSFLLGVRLEAWKYCN
ncbi:Exonuclease 3'-5' domain-containing protein 2 [Linum perenne]